MKKCLLLGFLGFLFLPLFAQHIPQKPSPALFVNDYAHLLGEGEIVALESKLHQYRDTTSTQIVVVTVASLEGSDVEGYANTLAREWGIGEKGKNNGILMLIAKEDHKMRIEVGYGLEAAIPDAACKEIERDIMKPYFKQGNFYQGIDAAVDRLIALASGEYKAEKGTKANGGVVLAFFAVILLLFVFSFLSKYNQLKRSHIGHDLSFWAILSLLNSMGNRHRGGGGGWGGGYSGGDSGGGSSWDFGGGDFGGGGASGDW